MAAINQARLDSIKKSLWDESDCKSFLLVCSQKRKTYPTTDDLIFTWLFSIFEPDSVLLIQNSSSYIFVSEQAAKKFKESADFFVRSVAEGATLSSALESVAGTKVATTKFTKASEKFANDPLFVNQQKLLEGCFIVQEENEQTRVRNACKIASASVRNIYINKLQENVSVADKFTLSDIAQDIASQMREASKVGLNVDPNRYEASFLPAVGSADAMDLNFPPTILSGKFISMINTVTIGVRYNGLNAAVGRTYFINPTNAIKSAWDDLTRARSAAIDAIKVGATFSSVYSAFLSALPPEMQHYVPHSIGGYTGVLVSTEERQITADSEEVIQDRSTIILSMSLKDVVIGDEKPFSIFAADTIQVNGASTVLSKNSVDIDSVAFTLKEDDTQAKVQEFLNDTRTIAERAASNAQKKKSIDQPDQETQELIQQFKQEKKTKKKVEEEEPTNIPEEQEHISYAAQDDIPKIDTPSRISIHAQHMTVFFPIYGMMVPFHISRIRNIQDESDSNGQLSAMRVNFEVPKIADTTATHIFVKELTYTAPGSLKFKGIAKQIRDLRAKFTITQKRKKVDREVYEEEPLAVLPNCPRLSGNLRMRPVLSDKMTTGTLEAHSNGFRYRTNKGGNQLIMYKNIRMAILQKSVTELNTVLHFYLKKAVRVNNKPTQHITFYKQVIAGARDVGNEVASKSDAAELGEEEHDRHVRKRINHEFSSFCKAVKELNLPNAPDFEQPKKQLSFDGIASKQVVTLYLMMNSIVSVMEAPPFVLMVEDIDVAMFERVILSLKYFDLVFVQSDWSKEVVQIVQIPTVHLPMIKEWLDAVGIQHFERKDSLDWTRVMSAMNKTGRETFEKEGGWSSYLEEEEEEEEESEAFDEEDAAEEASESSEEFADEGEEEDESEPAEEDDADGKDWRELAEEAAEHDRKAELRESQMEMHTNHKHSSSSEHHHHKHNKE